MKTFLGIFVILKLVLLLLLLESATAIDSLWPDIRDVINYGVNLLQTDFLDCKTSVSKQQTPYFKFMNTVHRSRLI